VKLDQKVTGICPIGAVAGSIETIRTRLIGGKLRAQIAEGLSSSKRRWR
jgi:hypothetical protein